MNEICLATVKPWFAAVVRKWLELCEKEGLGPIRLTEGLRGGIRQAELFGRGRSRAECAAAGVAGLYSDPTASRVTNAAPGESAHGVGKAVDWNAQDFSAGDRLKAARLARSCGLESGYWYTFRDACHIQVKGWHPKRR